VSLTRVLKTAAVTLVHRFYVDEVLTDASGPVTVTVKRLDGVTVITSGTANNDSTGVYSFVVPGYAQLDAHTVDWTGTFGGSATTVTDLLEIVGDYYFTIPEVRVTPTALPVTYTLAQLTAKRILVEQECERICGQAFVPRFHRALLNGTGTTRILVPHIDPQVVRAVSTATRAGGTFTVVSGSSLAAIAPVHGGVLVRDDGAVFPQGYRNVLVEYEYGRSNPPEDLRLAAMKRLRSLLTTATSPIPDRTLSFTDRDGGVYRLSTPSEQKTGMPEVDGVYEGYTIGKGSFA
jgi:hypothetical protein